MLFAFPRRQKACLGIMRGCVEGAQWMLADLNSSWGTFVNGTKLPADTEFPLAEGDLIRIGVWTLKLGSQPERRVLRSQDDIGQSIIGAAAGSDDAAADGEPAHLAPQRRDDDPRIKTGLKRSSPGDWSSGESGTGLRHAFILRPIDAAGGIEIVATSNVGPHDAILGKGDIGVGDMGGGDHRAPQQFSRSLIATAAARGGVADLCKNDSEETGNSIAQLKITCAMCVPLMLGESPAAFLYMDSRGGERRAAGPGAAPSARRWARWGAWRWRTSSGSIWKNGRPLPSSAELTAAAAAQSGFMPKRPGQFGRFNTSARAGRRIRRRRFLRLDRPGDGRLAVALGDVSGKGVYASVLMTAAQGYLHSAITRTATGGAVRAGRRMNSSCRDVPSIVHHDVGRRVRCRAWDDPIRRCRAWLRGAAARRGVHEIGRGQRIAHRRFISEIYI